MTKDWKQNTCHVQSFFVTVPLDICDISWTPYMLQFDEAGTRKLIIDLG